MRRSPDLKIWIFSNLDSTRLTRLDLNDSYSHRLTIAISNFHKDTSYTVSPPIKIDCYINFVVIEDSFIWCTVRLWVLMFFFSEMMACHRSSNHWAQYTHFFVVSVHFFKTTAQHRTRIADWKEEGSKTNVTVVNLNLAFFTIDILVLWGNNHKTIEKEPWIKSNHIKSII